MEEHQREPKNVEHRRSPFCLRRVCLRVGGEVLQFKSTPLSIRRFYQSLQRTHCTQRRQRTTSTNFVPLKHSLDQIAKMPVREDKLKQTNETVLMRRFFNCKLPQES